MKFEDDLLIKNDNGLEFEDIETLKEYFASIFCDGYEDDEDIDVLISYFFEDNELGEIPTMASEWVEILNDIDEGWYTID